MFKKIILAMTLLIASLQAQAVDFEFQGLGQKHGPEEYEIIINNIAMIQHAKRYQYPNSNNNIFKEKEIILKFCENFNRASECISSSDKISMTIYRLDTGSFHTYNGKEEFAKAKYEFINNEGKSTNINKEMSEKDWKIFLSLASVASSECPLKIKVDVQSMKVTTVKLDCAK